LASRIGRGTEQHDELVALFRSERGRLVDDSANVVVERLGVVPSRDV
jgi:hypothetical protein